MDGPFDSIKEGEDAIYSSGYRGKIKVFCLYEGGQLEHLLEEEVTDKLIVKLIPTNIGGHT